MALEPFSSGADTSGTSGVGGYKAGTGAASSSTGGLNPALGRSARDLASDSGPAAAPPGYLTMPDTDAETTTGAGRGDPDAADDRPRRKANPGVDPDTRLGLRPATAGMVAPQLPTYPESGLGTRVATSGVAGLVAAGITAVLMYGLFWSGLIPPPPSIAAARSLVGDRPVLLHALGILGSVLAGGVWGLLFGLVVRRPTILKGIVFGLVPALFAWLVLAPLTGRPMFGDRTAAAVGLPLLFNVLIWGTLLGYFAGRWLRPPYAAAVDPDLTTAVPNP